MPRVVGIDPGTVSVDICGLDDGRVFLDRSLPTSEALADPSVIVELLDGAGPLDLVAGPSGYGLPLTAVRNLTESDFRLAYLAAEGEAGGIGGLRSLVRMLGRSLTPVMLTPGVVHLASVPAQRKVNRVDMGTADKLCAAALAVASRLSDGGAASETSRSSCSSWAARSRRRSRWRTAGSWTAPVGRRDRLARVPRAPSTVRSRFSPDRCPSASCSAEARPRSLACPTLRQSRSRRRARSVGTWRGRRTWRAR